MFLERRHFYVPKIRLNRLICFFDKRPTIKKWNEHNSHNVRSLSLKKKVRKLAQLIGNSK